MITLVSSSNGSLHLSMNLSCRSRAHTTSAWTKERRKTQIEASKKMNLRVHAKGFTNTRPLGTGEGENGSINKERNIQNGNSDDEVPEEVFTRMMVRIVLSVVAPMGIGLGLTNFLGFLRDEHIWEVPKWLPYLTTFLAFGASTLGIPYGALSTPWDVNKKGSVLGLEEIQHNWNEMWKEEDEEERAPR